MNERWTSVTTRQHGIVFQFMVKKICRDKYCELHHNSIYLYLSQNMCGLLVSWLIIYLGHVQSNGVTWEVAILYSCFLLHLFCQLEQKIMVSFHHQPHFHGGNQSGNRQDLFIQLMDKVLVMSVQGWWFYNVRLVHREQLSSVELLWLCVGYAWLLCY